MWIISAIIMVLKIIIIFTIINAVVLIFCKRGKKNNKENCQNNDINEGN